MKTILIFTKNFILFISLFLLNLSVNASDFERSCEIYFDLNQKVDTIRILDTCNNREFNNFWKSFRNAILSDDTKFIENHTIFPLHTKGPLDGDPIIKFQKNKFESVFKQFLKQNEYLKDETLTIVEYVRETPSIITKFVKRASPILSEDQIYESACIVNECFMGAMVFKRKDNNWYLYLLYFEYTTYKMLKIEEYDDYY